MKRAKAMRNISRVDQEKKNQHGWLVRMMRDGRKFQKFFYDGTYGGKTNALRRAKEHRDELLRQYPPSVRGNMFNRTNRRNTSGHAGIHKTRSLKRGRIYDVWQAGWVLPNGQHVNRKFHYSPDGRSEAAALKLAIKARKEGLREVERMQRAFDEKRAARAQKRN
ncbi:MAG: hypothetical protein H0V27_01810 [Pyrinomonadaceae bacterium]|jgi:hypothetical protein|nr:hypothetical protein [Pyrinomonadaceae bacterium]